MKNRLGFTGIIVTDALEMQGLTKLYDPSQGSPTARAAVDAIKAGCDIISIPTDVDGAFHAIVNAVQSGEIKESRIDESVRKVLRVKASLGLDKSRLVDLEKVEAIVRDPQIEEFAQYIANSSVTLVRDNRLILPLKSAEPSVGVANFDVTRGRLVALLVDEAFASNDGKEFEKVLKARRPDAEVFYFDNRTAESVGTAALKANLRGGPNSFRSLRCAQRRAAHTSRRQDALLLWATWTQREASRKCIGSKAETKCRYRARQSLFDTKFPGDRKLCLYLFPDLNVRNRCSQSVVWGNREQREIADQPAWDRYAGLLHCMAVASIGPSPLFFASRKNPNDLKLQADLNLIFPQIGSRTKPYLECRLPLLGWSKTFCVRKLPGYMRMLTESHRFVIPLQAKRFEAMAPEVKAPKIST